MPRKAKRGLKKPLQKWECSEGCDVSQGICHHLEKMLPQMRDGDMPQLVDHGVAAQASVSFFDTVHWKFDLKEFQDEMRSFGITDSWDMDLLEARYYYGMSYRQIEREQNFVSRDTISRRLKKLHSLLEERGYKRKKTQ